MKKLVSLVLILATLVLTAACSEPQTKTGDDVATAGAGITETAETEPESTAEPLPDANMEGFELRFYNYNTEWLTWAIMTLDTESQIGEPINDEIYLRNRRIEEKYNAVITETAVKNTGDVFPSAMTAGEDLCDIAFVYDENTASYYTQNYIQTWDALPVIDLTQDWWMQNANNIFSIRGKQFAACGSFTLTMYTRSFVLLFNKELYNTLNPSQTMYEMVDNNEWTADKFCEVAINYVSDLDGDGAMTKADQYGIATAVKLHFGSLITGAGVLYVDVDEEGVPYFAIPNNDYAFEVMEHIFNLHDGNNVFYRIGSDVHAGSDGAIFKTGQTLFHGSNTKNIDSYRDLEFDIGILPYPKYSETQDKYYALTSGSGVPVIPVTLSEDRFENVGILLEALSRDSHEGLLPTYREVVLKSKYTRDVESEHMLDIIFDSASFDLGLSVWPQTTYYKYMDIYFRMNNNIASLTETLTPTIQKAIDDMMTALDEK